MNKNVGRKNIERTRTLIYSVLNSYSQIFFSDNKIFAGMLVAVSFLNLWAGLCGLLSVLISSAVAWRLGFSKFHIKKGVYGFNSLLVGLGLGIYFEPNFQLLLIVVFAAIFTLFASIVLQGFLGKYYLPFLSLPFLIVIWGVTIATRDFHELGLSTKGIYTANELYQIGGNSLVNIYYWFSNIAIPQSLRTYLLSLGAIFFQYNLLAGVVISLGLIIYSRIAFTLSLIGFFAAYTFYIIIGADVTTLSYSYIGFNFILTAIALGGFYLVPSPLSYLWVVLLLPIVTIITFSANAIFADYQLSIFSLPFNIVVIAFLYVLKLRSTHKKQLSEVVIQHNSPERNLYYFKNSSERFKELQYMPLSLPFWGEWSVSQGHNGEYTHKGEWKHAWDFVITNIDNKQFENSGDYVTDYFCYNKSVTASADGIIHDIIDGVEDNIIGDININQNWGNTIIIKHTDYLYTKLSHLKAGSIKPTKGSFVKKGEVIATCGNSGHSPYPHLHFQVQTTPYIGSKTIDYPISHFLTKSNSKYEFNLYKKPKQNSIVTNVDTNKLLKNALHFIPGQKLTFTLTEQGVNNTSTINDSVVWEVKSDVYNNTYIHCAQSNSFAYFYNDGNLHYFRDFSGDRESLLYFLFLALFKIPMGFYNNLSVKDNVPVNHIFGRLPMFFQDFVAPFTMFLKSKYKLQFVSIDDELSPSQIELKSEIKNYIFKDERDNYQFKITINKLGIQQINIKRDGDIILIAEQQVG